MRNAILQLPESRAANEERKVLRAAIRQLERADVYLAAVSFMNLTDRAAQREVNQLRSDVEDLRRHLCRRRDEVAE